MLFVLYMYYICYTSMLHRMCFAVLVKIECLLQFYQYSRTLDPGPPDHRHTLAAAAPRWQQFQQSAASTHSGAGEKETLNINDVGN